MHDEIEPLSPLNYKPTAHAQAVTKSKVIMQKKDALKKIIRTITMLKILMR